MGHTHSTERGYVEDTIGCDFYVGEVYIVLEVAAMEQIHNIK